MSSCVPGKMCLLSGVLISFDIVFVCDILRPDATGSLAAALNDPPLASERIQTLEVGK